MNNQAHQPPNSIISRRQFRQLTGLSRSSEWRLSRLGKLPSFVIVNGRILGYSRSDYNHWLASNTKEGEQ